MKSKSHKQKIFIIFFTIWIVVAISCTNQNKSNIENQLHQTKVDGELLKYTTGVRSFLEDSKGNIWFGSYNEGVCLLKNGKFQYFTTENGLSHNQVRNIYEDKNGVVWFECGRGLSIYDGEKIFIYKERNYDSAKQWKLADSDLWFKGDEIEGYNKLENNPGVYQYDGKKLSYRTFPVTPKSEAERRFGYSISTPFLKGKNGTIWFGTYNALIGYDGSDFKIITDKDLKFNGENGFLHIRGIFEDSKGNLWIANNGQGVLVYDGKEAINFTAQQKLKKKDTKGNSLDRAFSIGEDALGNIWLGTVESGVWKYDGKSVKNFTKHEGLESQQILTVHKSKKGELWLGGANPSGVFCFNGKSFERKY